MVVSSYAQDEDAPVIACFKSGLTGSCSSFVDDFCSSDGALSVSILFYCIPDHMNFLTRYCL